MRDMGRFWSRQCSLALSYLLFILCFLYLTLQQMYILLLVAKNRYCNSIRIYQIHNPNVKPSRIQENPKLKSVPMLSKDLQTILKLSCRTEEKETSQFASREICQGDGDDDHQSMSDLPVLDQDLNCLPNSVAISELYDDIQSGHNTAEKVAKKQKRAAAEDIARIALEDLAKYFDLPIVEASRNLKVGLTVLKRKCREFGIPRWPHRKIKSLNSLIDNLQEEADRQMQENEGAAMAVAKRQRMLEREREIIERRPCIEIQSETKRFRQDVFKRRHRARSLGEKGSFCTDK